MINDIIFFGKMLGYKTYLKRETIYRKIIEDIR